MVDNPYTKLINFGKTLLGPIAGGDYLFTVSRPPYANGDNTPVVISTGNKYHVEPAGPNWTEDRIPDLEYFEICGDPSTFELGDVISGANAIPKVTVCGKADGQEFLGFKTDKVGTIDNIELSYENLPFDYMNSTSAGPDEYFNEVSSLNVSTRRIVMWAIPGLPEGMTFTDQTGGWRWSISKIDYKSFLMVLYVEKPNRT